MITRRLIIISICIASFVLLRPVFALTWDEAQTRGVAFLETQLLDNSGGIYANLLDTYPNDPYAGVNHEMLSEYAGLAMEYAVYADRESFFVDQAQFVSTVLRDSRSGLYDWRVGSQLQNIADSSATIDDLRIVDGYLLAATEWNNTAYRDVAVSVGDALQQYAFRNSILVNATSWDDDGVYQDPIALTSYFDLPAMQRLSAVDAEWDAIEQTHVALLDDAAYGNGLYRFRYNTNTQQFLNETSLNTIHQLFIANYLAEAGYTTRAQESLDFYKEQFNTTGMIAGAYTPAGVADSPYEDISIYSLAASLAHWLGDDVFETTMLNTIVDLQIDNAASIYHGSFQWSMGDRVYAFVQLNALRSIALRGWTPPVPTTEPPTPPPEPPLAPPTPESDPSSTPLLPTMPLPTPESTVPLSTPESSEVQTPSDPAAAVPAGTVESTDDPTSSSVKPVQLKKKKRCVQKESVQKKNAKKSMAKQRRATKKKCLKKEKHKKRVAYRRVQRSTRTQD